MDATAKTAKLEEYRARIDAGEELPPQQFARYQDLVAWEARTAAGRNCFRFLAIDVHTFLMNSGFYFLFLFNIYLSVGYFLDRWLNLLFRAILVFLLLNLN